jgi:hypothetical protein
MSPDPNEFRAYADGLKDLRYALSLAEEKRRSGAADASQGTMMDWAKGLGMKPMGSTKGGDPATQPLAGVPQSQMGNATGIQDGATGPATLLQQMAQGGADGLSKLKAIYKGVMVGDPMAWHQANQIAPQVGMPMGIQRLMSTPDLQGMVGPQGTMVQPFQQGPQMPPGMAGSLMMGAPNGQQGW